LRVRAPPALLLEAEDDAPPPEGGVAEVRRQALGHRRGELHRVRECAHVADELVEDNSPAEKQVFMFFDVD
jgi:hypothetical protein